MLAELIAIGTELLLGEIVDSNTAWLAGQLANRGVDVYWSQRVGDNLGRATAAISQALQRSDLVVTVGGLGPTEDDLTREAIAAAVHETPAVDPALESHLRAWFAGRGVRMPDMNVKQAWLIPSSAPLPNALGTAPGWLVRRGHRMLVALPGPPREMERMWTEEALPRMGLPKSALFRRTYKTSGIGESTVAERLGNLLSAASPSVATYARADGVQVRVAAKGVAIEDAMRAAAPALEAVERALGDVIWGVDDDRMADVVRRRLLERGATLSTMESLTGGLLGSELASVPGISDVYRGGGISYATDLKALFGVPEEVLERHGAVSAETAEAMARAAADHFKSDYALSTTGVAGPSDREGKPPGTVFIGLHGPAGTESERLDLSGRTRDGVRERAVFGALMMLLRSLS